MISSKSLEGASEASSPGVARICSTSLSIGRPNASFPVWSTAQRLALILLLSAHGKSCWMFDSTPTSSRDLRRPLI